MNNILISLGVSLAVNLIGMYINYRAYADNHYLLWSYKMPGGECMAEFGFGWHVFHTYTMLPDGTNSHSLRFSPLILLIGVVAGALIIYLVLLLLQRFKAAG